MERFEQALEDIHAQDPDLELGFADVSPDASEIANENVKSIDDVKGDIMDIVYPELEEDLIAQIEENGGEKAPDALKEKAAEKAVEAAVSRSVDQYINSNGNKAWTAIVSGQSAAPPPKPSKKKATPGGGRGSQSSKGRGGGGRPSTGSRGRKAGGTGAFANRPMTMRPPSDSSINTQQGELVAAAGAQFALADAAAQAIQGNAQAGLRKTGVNGGGKMPGILGREGGGGGGGGVMTRKNSGGPRAGGGAARKNSGGPRAGGGAARKNSGGMNRGRGGSQGRPGHQRSGSEARRKMGAISDAQATSSGLAADPAMALADVMAGLGGGGGGDDAPAPSRSSNGRKRGASQGRSAAGSMGRSAGGTAASALGDHSGGGGGGGNQGTMTEDDRVAARKARARARTRTNSGGRRPNKA